jgi:Subtilase family
VSSLASDSPDDNERFWQQLDEVRRQLYPMTLLVEPPEAEPGSGIAPLYVYEAGVILVRDADMHRVRPYTTAPVVDSSTPGVHKLQLDDGTHVPTEADRLNWHSERHSHGAPGDGGGSPARRPASPNHLLSIAPVNLCPAAEPRPVSPATPLWPQPRPLARVAPPAPAGPGPADPAPAAPVPAPPVPAGPGSAPAAAGPAPAHAARPASAAGPADAAVPPGTGISVLVIDTGFQAGVVSDHPFLAGVNGDPRQLDNPAPGLTDVIKEYAGHGTFVTGVLRTFAPGASVTVSGALQDAGALDEHCLGAAIMKLLDNPLNPDQPWPHIISISGGATTQDNQELAGLGALFDELATDRHAETVLIAAAGNDGQSEHKFWPAAGALTHPGVISVGALRRDGQGRACFSNYGDWVTVYAYGENVINAFPSGLYAYQHASMAACRYHSPALYPECGCVAPVSRYGDVVAFDSTASWSGTSFATPLVAGMVAAHMTRLTEKSDARAAARDLLARFATPIADQADGAQILALR